MFRELVTYENAKKMINKNLNPKPLGSEEVHLKTAFNRILSEDVIAKLEIPPFKRSTVDGYAIKVKDLYGADEANPVELKNAGYINIGKPPEVDIFDGEAAEIVTGAPIPEGADAVVMVEYTERVDKKILVYCSVTKGENIQKKGSDIKKNDVVLQSGKILGSREIGTLAALGRIKASVYKRPKVAVISTGGEVTEPGCPLSAGKVYDINAYALSTAVLESGGHPIFFGTVPDEYRKLEEKLKEALTLADIVLTSGGVSVGPKDIVPMTVNAIGEPGIIFSGIALKPGKPVTFAIANGKPIFSFPGHPTSALLTFQLFARPVIQIMAGNKEKNLLKIKAILKSRIFSAKGRRTFVMVRIKREDSKTYATPVETGESGSITTLTKADGFVEIPEYQQFFDRDDEIEVSLFND